MTDPLHYRTLTDLPQDSRIRGHNAAFDIQRALVRYANEHQLEDYEVESLAYDAYDAYENLLIGTNDRGWDEATKLKPWYNRLSAVRLSKKVKDPFVSMPEIEGAAQQYLQLPFRVDRLDRMLTDAIMASEILDFIDHPSTWALRRKLFGWGLLVDLAIVALLLWASDGATWAKVVSGLLLAWPFVFSLFRHRTLPAKLIRAMTDSYQFMAGGVTSVAELRAAVERARVVGVVWPNTLYVLLEDIAERRKSI